MKKRPYVSFLTFNEYTTNHPLISLITLTFLCSCLLSQSNGLKLLWAGCAGEGLVWGGASKGLKLGWTGALVWAGVAKASKGLF